MSPRLSIVVAVARNGVIGRENGLPWHLPADLRHFKALTMGKPMLMGRRTWESLPGLLPGRPHIVLTGTRGYRAEGAQVVHSLEEALATAGDAEEVMVIGGASLYAQALPLAQRLHLTEIDADVEGDTRFPQFDRDAWREVSREAFSADQSNRYDYRFLTYERKAQEESS